MMAALVKQVLGREISQAQQDFIQGGKVGMSLAENAVDCLGSAQDGAADLLKRRNIA
jgi:hypothetical protein